MSPRSASFLFAVLVAILAPTAAVAQQPDGPGVHVSIRLPPGTRGPQLTFPRDVDPAAVVGTDVDVVWRDEAPAGQVEIHWTAADRPGGVLDDELQVVQRVAGAWQPVAPAMARMTSGQVTLVAPPAGEYAVRWWPPITPCTDAVHRQLDYRLGHWDYRATGYDPGRSDVTEDRSRCALYDRFVDATGGRSDAFIIYNAAEAQWYVTTWDPDGRTIGRGTATRDGIVLMQSATEREVYRRRLDGGIDFSVERSGAGGVTWRTWATGLYTRVHEE